MYLSYGNKYSYINIFRLVKLMLICLIVNLFFQSMENGLNPIAVQFAMQLVKLYLVDERNSGLVTEVSFMIYLYTL